MKSELPAENFAGFSFAALMPWAKQALAPGCCVTSDGLLGFEVLERLKYEHKVVQAPRGKAGTEIEPFKWLNIVLGNLKTALSGTHHAFNFKKYARRYLAKSAVSVQSSAGHGSDGSTAGCGRHTDAAMPSSEDTGEA